MRSAREMRLEADEWLWRKGAEADANALVISGTLCVHGGGQPRSVGPGSLVGFAELFAERPRDLGARADGPCVVLLTDRAVVLDAMEDHFDLSLDLLNALATRHLAL